MSGVQPRGEDMGIGKCRESVELEISQKAVIERHLSGLSLLRI